MNRKQYAEMMHQINAVRENGGDVEACVASFREKYKYVYVYNDSCFKKIFGSIENRSVASDFLNAVLKFDGDDYELRKMYFIALQLFDSFPNSGNYRHCVQLKDDDNHVFFEKDSLTIVEIKKFHKNKYVHDFSPLAEWLRAVEHVNNEDDSPLPGTLSGRVYQKTW